MLSKEQYEKLKYQIAMHKPVSSVVAMGVDSVESLFEMIDKMEENATAQGLALKESERNLAKLKNECAIKSLALEESKSMLKDECKRADKNEINANRYNWLREYMASTRTDMDDFIVNACGDDCPSSFDDAIDQAMSSHSPAP